MGGCELLLKPLKPLLGLEPNVRLEVFFSSAWTDFVLVRVGRDVTRPRQLDEVFLFLSIVDC